MSNIRLAGLARLNILARLVMVGVVAMLALVQVKPAFAAVTCTPATTTLNIVAHEDDDLLFLNPDVLHDIADGRCVRTVFVTAGDAGAAASYWKSRENGAKAAYAKMTGKANSWTNADAGVAGHPIPVFTLSGKPKVSLAFMRLPDGAVDGTGFTDGANGTLQGLWEGSAATIRPVNGTASYTKQSLTSTLTTLMVKFQPSQLRVQDYLGAFGDGDHSDHYATAFFARAAHLQYATPHTITGYQGYPSLELLANVTGADLTKKSAAFYAYAAYDNDACNSAASCNGGEYAEWLKRQYAVGSEGSGGPTPTPSPTPTPNPTTTPTPSPTPTPTSTPTPTPSPTSTPSPTPTPTPTVNIAPQATVTASSQDTSTGQLAIRAVDGAAVGYPGDYTKEWATVEGLGGSWLKLAWSSPRTISKIVLYDRPNLFDQITGATITFSDGSSINTGALTNDGQAVTFTFPTKSVTSLQLNIIDVGEETANVGLAEIQVY